MRLRAYGMDVVAPGVELPGASEGPAAGAVRVHRADREEVAAAFSGPCDPPRTARRRVDGRAVDYERGAGGDLRIEWAGAGAFHADAAGATVLAWAPDERPAAAWIRFLLDSVLSSVALHRGSEALHAGAVTLPGRPDVAVAVAAGQGGGKTTLLGELLRRGGLLVADDVCVVRPAAGARPTFVVEPAPPVLNIARSGPPGAPAPEELGEVLADLDGELWVRAAAVAAGPVALAAVVRLERRPGADLRSLRSPASPVALLPHVLESGPSPDRRASRFALVADLARDVPFLVLEGPPEASPAALAGALLAGVAETLG